MKKLITILTFILLLSISCEEVDDSIESKYYFFNGEWTLHLTGKITNWFVCFDIDNASLGDSYFCNGWLCSDWNSNYKLKLFEFRSHDSTLLIKTQMGASGNYMYYGAYNNKKDVFVGPTYWSPADQPSVYFMYSNNDSIIRGKKNY